MTKQITTKGYHTFWKQGKLKGTYKTKSLTSYHKWLHTSPKIEYARTIETDSSIDWPFGLYGEIIGITDRKNPKNNKPLPSTN